MLTEFETRPCPRDRRASESGLSVIAVRDAAALAALAPRWDALAGEVPFRSWPWADSWWRHYASRRNELFTLVVANHAGEPLGIAPWYLETSARGGRVLRFLGSGEICSDYLTILCHAGCEAAVAERLADWLARDANGAWHLLDLDGVSPGDPVIATMAQCLVRQGHAVHWQQLPSAWRISLPADWTSYLGTLSKPRRNRSRAELRSSIESGRATVRRVTTAAELEQGFEILIDLHQRRRKSLAEPGCFTSPRFTAFHREVSARLLERGQLRLSWIEMDGRPVAVDYSFADSQVVYYYQGGFDPDLADERPGSLANLVALKSAVDEHFAAYDFMRGDEPYKAWWGCQPQALARLRVAGRQPSAVARFATWRGSSAVKQWTRQVVSKAKG
jgi:CelD/BcsL family acetyltransferase involved in cellulose biosynthesis